MSCSNLIPAKCHSGVQQQQQRPRHFCVVLLVSSQHLYLVSLKRCVNGSSGDEASGPRRSVCFGQRRHTHTFEMRASCWMLHLVCVILHPRQILKPALYFFFVATRLFPLQRGHSKKRKFKAETPSSMWSPPLPLQPVCFLKGLSGRREYRPTGWPAGASLLRQSRGRQGRKRGQGERREDQRRGQSARS